MEYYKINILFYRTYTYLTIILYALQLSVQAFFRVTLFRPFIKPPILLII